MKLITFEGHGGSGKTTQQLLLCNRLDIEPTSFYDEYYVYAKRHYRHTIGSKDKSISLLLTLAQIRSKIEEWQSTQNIHVVDHFHEGFIGSEYTDEKAGATIMRFFRDALRIEPSITPLASFYLYIPTFELKKRRIKQDYDVKDEASRQYARPPSERDLNHDTLRKRFYEQAASVLGYFHFIECDEKSPAVIHAEIYDIVKGLL